MGVSQSLFLERKFAEGKFLENNQLRQMLPLDTKVTNAKVISKKFQSRPFFGNNSLFHAYVSVLKPRKKETRDVLCPQCNLQMKEKNDNVLGVNFDGSYYIKKAITTHLCHQCNYLLR